MGIIERKISNEQVSSKNFSIPLIVVAGLASGAGKTSVAESIIKFLSAKKKTAAAKITVTHGERGCPHGGKGCNTCSSLGGDFQIVTNLSIITQRGTDTARFELAGGKPVIWAITRDVAIEKAWSEMKKQYVQKDCIVVESNTLALITKPSLTVMVVDPTVSERIWKPSADGLLDSAEIIVFNDRGSDAKKKDLLRNRIEKLRGNLDGVIYVRSARNSYRHSPSG
jgi:molybdopterin-guanine dinucleotide biosynthesis protein